MATLTTDIPALVITLVIGTLGGIIAWAAHLPLGLLLGSLGSCGLIAAIGWKPFGRPITLPPRLRLRLCFVPVIGVAIGGAFTPAVAGQALGWGPSLLALCLFVPLAHGMGFWIFRRGGLMTKDAFFGSIPGGLIESVQMGEEAGANVALLTALQFLRLILTIVAVPIIFWALTGHAVGSAAGAVIAGSGHRLGFDDAALLTGAAVLGVALGKTMRLPGWIITGPVLVSALGHGLGWIQGVPPAWLLGVTQIVVGAGLGARFEGVEHATLFRAVKLAVINGVASLCLAFGFAVSLHALVGEPVAGVFLAFAPGGLAEMSLVALSLQLSVIYVTAHHVVRIMLAVTIANFGSRILGP